MRRALFVVSMAMIGTLVSAPVANACGSLVAPNGAVRLVRTSTLAAYHDGVEHYVTNFEFASPKTSFGSIIPLPGAPTKVERGGKWTLQRLEREVAPALLAQGDATRAAANAGVEILQHTQIDSLDVTILRGGGADVAAWAAKQGFTLTPDTPKVLEFYSRRSPFFMAAKFDATAAVARGLRQGDGIPVHLTIPAKNPWVPLHILGTGKPADEIVNADVFLLTDEEPALLAGTGLTLEHSEPASTRLLDDLRGDDGMGWVPSTAWLSFLKLATPVRDLDYDLAVDASAEHHPRVVDTGRPISATHPISPDNGVEVPWYWLALGSAAAAAAGAGFLRMRKRVG
jgi:hypothetical protein